MFSRYDVYTTVQSIYCYRGTDVLKNRLNIRDKEELKKAEEDFVAIRQLALLQKPLKGNFTKTHLMRIHRYLFGDIYSFAGRIRREQISKGDTFFYPPDLIERELNRVFRHIHENQFLRDRGRTEQINNLSYLMSELNLIHPFREGNGRSIRELVRCMALEYGLIINWGNTSREELLDAAVESVTDNMAFCDVLENCLEMQ